MAGAVQEFYGNDIVYRFDKRKRIVFGVVTESYEASSDVDEIDNLEKGQIRVWWFMSSREQIWKQSRVRLLNRSILPGDIVRRFVQGLETQRGYCKSAKQLVTLQIVGTDKIIEKVCHTRLKPVSKYYFERIVCMDNKIGRIQNVYCKVTMQAKCGSSVEVSRCSSSHTSHLDDYWLSKRNRWYSGTYYPGQEVICIPQYLHGETWLHKSKTMKRRMQSRMRFTIQNVEIESVDVIWYGKTDSDEIDKSSIKGADIKKLKVLETDESHIFDLAERMFLKLSASDKILKKADWLKKQSSMYKLDIHKVTSKHALNRAPRFRRSSSTVQSIASVPAPPTVSDGEEWWTDDGGESDNGSTSSSTSARPNRKKKHWPPRPKEIVPGNTLAVEVLCFESKVTVVWQDGTIEEDIPSTQLYYSMSLDDHEFFPGEWVVTEGNQNGEEYGCVQSVNHLERTAKVQWFRSYSKEGDKSTCPSVLHTTELSVYDLQKHQKFQFRPGSIVHLLDTDTNTAVSSTTTTTTATAATDGGGGGATTTAAAVAANATSALKIGTVLDSYPEGYVHIRWMDGTETKSWPQDLIMLQQVDYDIISDTSTEFAPGSWETESEESIEGDNLLDEKTLALMASKLDYIRSKMIYLKEMLKIHPNNFLADNLTYMRDLLTMYDNFSYLDKLLGTSFFSRKSRHLKAILEQVRDRAKSIGIELGGRLFSSDEEKCSRMIDAENDNMEKVRNLETALNAQISQSQSIDSICMSSTPDGDPGLSNQNLCVELLSMLKTRMDLAYAEVVSRIGGQEALMVMTKASENTPIPTVPNTPDDVPSILNSKHHYHHHSQINNVTTIITSPTSTTTQTGSPGTINTPDSLILFGFDEGYAVLEEAPILHNFHGTKCVPSNPQTFFKAVRREIKLLETSLPAGVWVRGYSDRIDLLSVMIRGPSKTPYEDGLFLFDIQLGSDYPHAPPSVHFISFSTERLNPNLYVEGKVCVSLLGTWVGKGSEVWGPSSSLLQLIVSIQGLILVSEPYYNEAGYEKQVESQQGCENSRTYNELVVLKLVQAMNILLQQPPAVFRAEILKHFSQNGKQFCERIERWTSQTEPHCPDFPLLPVSKGFLLSLESALRTFKQICATLQNYPDIQSSSLPETPSTPATVIEAKV